MKKQLGQQLETFLAKNQFPALPRHGKGSDNDDIRCFVLKQTNKVPDV